MVGRGGRRWREGGRKWANDVLVWGDCGEIAHLQEGDRELAPVGGARLPLLLEHADLGLERCVRVGWVEHKRGRERGE